MIRKLSALLALLLVCASAVAQDGKAKTHEASEESPDSSIRPQFQASLLNIKADWTQSPAAKEIEADLRKAWGQDHPNLKQLDKDLKAGPGLLFSPDASIYTREHYVQVLLWLKARQLVVHSELFMGSSASNPNQAVSVSLKKDCEFFGIEKPSWPPSEAFFTHRRDFTWSVRAIVMTGSTPQFRGFHITRELVDYEKGRGQEEFHPADPNEYDLCDFGVSPLADGQVLIVHAFPAAPDREFLNAAYIKGFVPLIVVEKGKSPLKDPAEAKLLLPDKVQRIHAQRTKGMRGGGGMGFFPTLPAWAPALPASGSQARMVIANNVMVSWSEAKDVAWGFSKALGKWAEQKLDPPATDTPPIVSHDLAVWRVGSSYYGFSGIAGRWDVLRLPENHTPPPVLDDAFARVHDGDDLHTFAASTGRWSSPKNARSAAESEPIENPIKVFQLRNAKAAAAERVIRELLGDRLASMAVDERTNSLIISSPRRATRADADQLLAIVNALLMKLDEPGEGTTTSSTTPAAHPAIPDLKGRYTAQDEAAAAIAREIRDLRSAPEAHKLRIEELTQKLRRAVADAFGARQQLQQAEAAQLQERIASIRKDLQTRQKLSDQIIDRRVQDLLNPDLQWDSRRGPGGAGSRTSQSPDATSVLEPAGGEDATTGATANVPTGAQRAYRDKLRERWKEVDELYRNGRLPFTDLLDAERDLAHAELAASTNLDERRASRQEHVNRLREIKAVVDAKFQEGLEPNHPKLAVDAALLWAESELTAETSTERIEPATQRSTNSAASIPIPSSPLALTIGRAGEPTTFRSAEEFRSQLQSLENALRLAEETGVSKIGGQTAEQMAKAKQRVVEARRRDLAFLREEYAAQLRLLELELQDAQLALDSAAQQVADAKKLFEKGIETKDSLLARERAVQEAKLRINRATTLLDLYRKADEKAETPTP